MSKISFLVCFVLVSFVIVDVSFAKDEPKIETYELKKGDITVKFTNWGATITSLLLPDKNGKVADVVLGYDSVDDYKNDTVYFGALVGRVANRIANGQFKLDGNTYKLSVNDGKNTLHGGKQGFGDVIWTMYRKKEDGDYPYITFTYKSADGEEGFPGSVSVAVTYMLNGENKLSVKMVADVHDKATPVNLAQHTYWNLGGHDSGDILSNEVQLFASKITPTDDTLIPTGKLDPVKNTPYDFLQPQTVGSRINQLPKGYDINYAVDGPVEDKMRKVAVVYDSKSGRKMELMSNQPGVQFYTGNMLKDVKGKGGAVYKQYAGLCLETQGYPDAVNHPDFPSMIVKPGNSYKHVMMYRFSTK